MKHIDDLNDFLSSSEIISEILRYKTVAIKEKDDHHFVVTSEYYFSVDSDYLQLFWELLAKAPPGYVLSGQALEGFFFLGKAMVDCGETTMIERISNSQFPQLLNQSWKPHFLTVFSYTIATHQNEMAKLIADLLYHHSPSLLVPETGENPFICSKESGNDEMLEYLTKLRKPGAAKEVAS